MSLWVAVNDWAERRAVHGGHAHLAELREILAEYADEACDSNSG